jgi:hypothetical protein
MAGDAVACGLAADGVRAALLGTDNLESLPLLGDRSQPPVARMRISAAAVASEWGVEEQRVTTPCMLYSQFFA